MNKSIWTKELITNKVVRKIFKIANKVFFGLILLIIALLILITIIGSIADPIGKARLKKYRNEFVELHAEQVAQRANSTGQYDKENDCNAWDQYSKAFNEYEYLSGIRLATTKFVFKNK